MRDASPLESIRAKADCTEATTATSHSSADAFPPAARILSTAAPAALKSRSRAKTRAPFWANVDAIARPIPDPAPVTIAFFPSSRNKPACPSDVNSKTGERYMTNDQHDAHNAARDQDCPTPALLESQDLSRFTQDTAIRTSSAGTGGRPASGIDFRRGRLNRLSSASTV